MAMVIPAVRTASALIAVPVRANVAVLSCKGCLSWEESSTRQLTTTHASAPRDTRQRLALLESSRDRPMTAMDLTAASTAHATTCQWLRRGTLVSFPVIVTIGDLLSNDPTAVHVRPPVVVAFL